MTKRPHHPWLETVNPDFGELLSDADPAAQGVVEMGDGSMIHVPPEGSIPHQLRLTRARSSGTAATRDIQAAHKRDREYIGGATPEIDLYGE